MKKQFVFGLILLLVILAGVGIWAYARRASAPAPASPIEESGSSVSSETLAPGTQTASSSSSGEMASTSSSGSGITLLEVKTHATTLSCWAAINGVVYDLTSWISEHPGGPEKIEAICGTDASAAFNGQHGGQPRPERELARFKLALLVK